MTRESHIDALARTIWAEARGEGTAGMEAVSCVIMNRLQVAKEQGKWWWGSTVEEICLKPYQFSCWNKDDPNRAKIYTVDASDTAFKEALEIAEDAIDGFIPDRTNDATHYLNPKAVQKLPPWAKGRPLKIIGNHHFYRPPEVPQPKEKESSCSNCSTPSPITKKTSQPLVQPLSLSPAPLPTSSRKPPFWARLFTFWR